MEFKDAFLVLGPCAAAAAAWHWTRRNEGTLRAALTQTQGELLKERVKIETLLQNITDGLVIANLRGEVMYINTEAMRILGAKPEEVTTANEGLYELVNRDQFRMKIQRILKNHTHSEVTEMQVLADAGHETRYYKTTVQMFTTPIDGEFGVAVLLRDVTAEKKLAGLKEEFFHAVAHDLRAPLFAVQGYLRLLEKSIPPAPQQRRYFDAISQACEKLTLFISDTLDSARMEAGHLQLSLSRVEPRQLLERLAKLFAPLAAEKGIDLELELPHGEDTPVEVDERLMERVFHNLLSNAVKFTPAGGRISVSMSRAGPDQVEFSVADTGLGVPPEEKTRIFEKYRQLETGELKSGFGLGLNICAKIVKLHNGTVWVDSEPGLGSQFNVRIPVKQQSRKEAKT